MTHIDRKGILHKRSPRSAYASAQSHKDISVNIFNNSQCLFKQAGKVLIQIPGCVECSRPMLSVYDPMRPFL